MTDRLRRALPRWGGITEPMTVAHERRARGARVRARRASRAARGRWSGIGVREACIAGGLLATGAGRGARRRSRTGPIPRVDEALRARMLARRAVRDGPRRRGFGRIGRILRGAREHAHGDPRRSRRSSSSCIIVRVARTTGVPRRGRATTAPRSPWCSSARLYAMFRLARSRDGVVDRRRAACRSSPGIVQARRRRASSALQSQRSLSRDPDGRAVRVLPRRGAACRPLSDIPWSWWAAVPPASRRRPSCAAAGIEHVVLERGDAAGHSWTNLYDSLTLHTGKHLSALPRMSFDRRVPLFPSRRDFVAYLHRYVEVFELPIETGRTVTAVEREGDGGWSGPTAATSPRATSSWRRASSPAPRMPSVPGRERFRGRVMHSVEYRRPAGFEGRRVLVVGVGNSGGEIGERARERGRARDDRRALGRERRSAAGSPVFRFNTSSFAMRALPKGARAAIAELVGRMTELRRGKPVLPKPAHGPLDAIPLIGFHLVDAIQAGTDAVRGGVAALTETGARFTDGVEEPFDDVIFATGFTAALAPLGDLVRTDAKGFAVRTDRVTSADQPHLYFVGHTYDATGGLYNISRTRRWRRSASRRAARRGRGARLARDRAAGRSTLRALERTPSSWRCCWRCSSAASSARSSPRRWRRRGSRQWPAGTPGSCRIATCCRRRSCFSWSWRR